jgi:RNA recognition motif-containing protein
VKGTYGFIIYEDERDAEDAIEQKNGMTFMGQKYVG